MAFLEKAGTPLPPPQKKGENVSESLLKALSKLDNAGLVSKLIEKRVEYGLKKYGQYLLTDDHRDTVVDAMQEAGDLLQYIWKAKMQKLDLTDIKYVVSVINKVLDANVN